MCVTCGFTFAGVGIVSWGVVPNSHEVTPEPPKGGAEMLAQNNGLFVCDADAAAGTKRAYFTFDLGYEAGHTTAVLDILRDNGIHAIFFLCSNYLQEDELVGRMIAEGHTLGNHTDKHRDLPTLGDDAMKRDINDFDEKFIAKYGDVYGRKLTHFRPPQGRFSERVLREVAGRGLKTVMWSIAIVDWGKSPIPAQPNADKIAKRIHPGAVILSHITNSGTPEMLKLLIPQLHEKGYSFGDSGKL